MAVQLPVPLVSPTKSQHNGKGRNKATSLCTDILHQEQRKLISGCRASLALCVAERNNQAWPWRRQRQKGKKSFPCLMISLWGWGSPWGSQWWFWKRHWGCFCSGAWFNTTIPQNFAFPAHSAGLRERRRGCWGSQLSPQQGAATCTSTGLTQGCHLNISTTSVHCHIAAMV